MSLQVTTFVNGKWRQNCYIVTNCEGAALVVDPGSHGQDIISLVDENHWQVQAIVNSHAHIDHVGAVAEIKDYYQVPFYLHAADEGLLKRANLYRAVFGSTDPIRIPSVTYDLSGVPATSEIGPFAVSWIATPGHTEGSVCLLVENFLFSGDTLMHNAVGRTDLPGGNAAQLSASLQKLMALPGETVVCGGHGKRTTITAEFSAGSPVWKFLQ